MALPTAPPTNNKSSVTAVGPVPIEIPVTVGGPPGEGVTERRPGSIAPVRVTVSAPRKQIVHVVKPNETLWQIAEHYHGDGAYWRSIAEANPNAVASNGWIHEGVRLSIPILMGTPGTAAPGTPAHGRIQSSVWRATTDVQHRARESWILPDDSPPRVVAIRPHQPNLPRHAYQFDGTSGMTHEFFHVSDPDAPIRDGDDSATFELWLKIDALTEDNAILFETGGHQRGVSLSLGDDDQDGIANDVRLGVGGRFGPFMVVSDKIDQFADPTHEFVHLVGVIDDGFYETAAELYVNGASIGRNVSRTTIDWDGVGEAGLGAVAGELGGPVGGAIAGNHFSGKIAQFRFFNRALDDAEILDHYNAALGPPGHGIHAVVGDAELPAAQPASVAEGDWESDSAIRVFHERLTELDQDLRLDVLASHDDTTFGSGGTSNWLSGIAAAGTEINSYFLHFDPIGQHPREMLNTTATFSFDNEILGLIIESTSLNDTDVRLGAVGRYMTGTSHGFDLISSGTISIFDNNHKLTVHMNVSSEQISQLRVITAVPEPATAGLLIGFVLFALPAMSRSRTRRRWRV